MQNIPRALHSNFHRKLKPNKVLMILGPRRSGKTALVRQFTKDLDPQQSLILNGEDVLDAVLLQERSVANYSRLLAGKNLLVIDEAQHIPDIGLILKLIVDSIDGIQVIATGSSSFDMHQQVGEPLVGRKNTLFLYPLAQMEFAKVEDFKTTLEKREERLIFGGYPELIRYSDWKDKEDYLYQIMNDYLLKDILMVDGVKNSDKLYSLLRLVAFQVGKEVSLEELGRQLGMSKNTVERYLDLLSKVFVVFKIGGYSRNLRKEIVKNSRWYFYDNGVRNAIIQNFNRLDMRGDVGDLWENYVAVERMKFQNYSQMHCNNYFWRTYDQQEIDWVEEEGDLLRAFEFKYQNSKAPKVPGAWAKAYPEASYEIIHSGNYLDWIGA
ncbi:putative AAA+ superfamily ATPase [Algoriphagus sp. 4150]|uniref:ATP-binding protein n=1 Tax=Algoriphagus sp. 4150 TaxID=2817756 RepID=UPI00285E1570|nr:ATP-binding protein [Algoriphagus sp. 4150]MDR7131175.1 putative AAA+ superfamily ATPase [Algoriphagus sp. 4150]